MDKILQTGVNKTLKSLKNTKKNCPTIKKNGVFSCCLNYFNYRII